MGCRPGFLPGPGVTQEGSTSCLEATLLSIFFKISHDQRENEDIVTKSMLLSSVYLLKSTVSAEVGGGRITSNRQLVPQVA